MATSTKKLITLRINNSIFRKNYVWNRENCPYDYPESGDNAGKKAKRIKWGIIILLCLLSV
jgi:hypothetical protein